MSGPARPLERLALLGRQLDWWLDGPILNPIRRYLAAVVVSAGPWLIAVFALIMVSRTLSDTLDPYYLEDLRLLVVYAFMLAPLAAAPTGLIAARVVQGDDPDPVNTGALVVITSGVSGLVALALALIVAVLLRLGDAELVLAFVLLTSSSAMMWAIFPVLAALRARRRLIVAFGTGMGSAVALTTLIGPHLTAGIGVAWCFIIGTVLSFTLCALPYRHHATNPDDLRRAVAALSRAAGRAWPLAVGALCTILGAWADKWVYWLSPDHLTSNAGFLHFPPYDSVMFFAHLSALPALATLAAFNEGPLAEGMRHFRRGITEGDTLPGLNRRVDALRAIVWDGLARIFGAQIVVTAGLILVAAAVAEAVNLPLDQFLLLRVGLLGAALHALFLAASAILALTNSRTTFAFLQGIFLALNVIVSTTLAMSIGVSALGLTLAAAMASVVAIPLAARSLDRLVRLTFLDENESLF